MSIRVMSWVWEHSPAAGTDLLVLLAIADNADDSGGNAWPSIATLGRKCRISPRTVQRAIRKLSLDGLLDVDEQAGRGGSNRYRLVMDTPRQVVTPPVRLAPRQDDAPVTGDTPPLTPVSPEPSLNRPSTPPPPASGGPDVDHCQRHVRHRRTCPDCLTASAALTAKPAWCGGCDERTRLLDGDGDVVERCPDCHPLSERTTA